MFKPGDICCFTSYGGIMFNKSWAENNTITDKDVKDTKENDVCVYLGYITSSSENRLWYSNKILYKGSVWWLIFSNDNKNINKFLIPLEWRNNKQ